ncbi:MAG: DMT family transporter [Pseudomonadota bacterium]
MSDETNSSTLAGILLVIAGVSLGAVNGALFKALTPLLPEVMITFFRYLIYLSIMLPVALWRRGPAIFRPAQPLLQTARGVIQALGTLAFVIAAVGMPVADAIALLYVYPFIVTALAPLVLSERVSGTAWLGVAGGFAGILIIMQPGFEGVSAYALWAVLCGVCVAVQLLLNRKLAQSAGVIATSTFGALVGAVLLGVMVPFHWQAVSMEAALLLLVLGTVTALNQVLLLAAFARAEASTLAPFGYFEIIAAVMVGYLWFGDLPRAAVWSGIVLIIISGLLVARTRTTARSLIGRRRGRPV